MANVIAFKCVKHILRGHCMCLCAHSGKVMVKFARRVDHIVSVHVGESWRMCAFVRMYPCKLGFGEGKYMYVLELVSVRVAAVDNERAHACIQTCKCEIKMPTFFCFCAGFW